MVINVLIIGDYNNTPDGTSEESSDCGDGGETTGTEKNPTGFQRRLQSPGLSVLRSIDFTRYPDPVRTAQSDASAG